MKVRVRVRIVSARRGIEQQAAGSSAPARSIQAQPGNPTSQFLIKQACRPPYASAQQLRVSYQSTSAGLQA